jgi:hypothetical protein
MLPKGFLYVILKSLKGVNERPFKTERGKKGGKNASFGINTAGSIEPQTSN